MGFLQAGAKKKKQKRKEGRCKGHDGGERGGCETKGKIREGKRKERKMEAPTVCTVHIWLIKEARRESCMDMEYRQGKSKS